MFVFTRLSQLGCRHFFVGKPQPSLRLHPDETRFGCNIQALTLSKKTTDITLGPEMFYL